jgi:hypothetical protein
MGLRHPFQMTDQEVVQPLAGGFFVHRDCFHLGACRGFGAPYNVFH